MATQLNRNLEHMSNISKISARIETPNYTHKPSTISKLCECIGLGSSASDIKGRKDSAKEYLEDAKDFEVDICVKIAEINRIQIFLDTVKINLDEEEKNVDSLEDLINSKKSVIYDEVVEQLQTLITEYVFSTDGKVNKKYTEAVDRLKRLVI